MNRFVSFLFFRNTAKPTTGQISLPWRHPINNKYKKQYHSGTSNQAQNIENSQLLVSLSEPGLQAIFYSLVQQSSLFLTEVLFKQSIHHRDTLSISYVSNFPLGKSNLQYNN